MGPAHPTSFLSTLFPSTLTATPGPGVLSRAPVPTVLRARDAPSSPPFIWASLTRPWRTTLQLKGGPPTRCLESRGFPTLTALREPAALHKEGLKDGQTDSQTDRQVLVLRAAQLCRLTLLPPTAGRGLPGKVMALPWLLWMWLLLTGTQGELSPGECQKQQREKPSLSCLNPSHAESWWFVRCGGDARGFSILSSGNQRDLAGGAHWTSQTLGVMRSVPFGHKLPESWTPVLLLFTPRGRRPLLILLTPQRSAAPPAQNCPLAWHPAPAWPCQHREGLVGEFRELSPRRTNVGPRPCCLSVPGAFCLCFWGSLGLLPLAFPHTPPSSPYCGARLHPQTQTPSGGVSMGPLPSPLFPGVLHPDSQCLFYQRSKGLTPRR